MESAPATQTKESTHLTPSDAAYYLIKPTLSPDFPRTDYKQGGCLAFAYGGAPFGPEQTYLECTWAGRAASWAWRERIEKEAERAGRPASEVKVAVEDTCFALAVFDKVWEIHYWDRCQNIPYHEPSRTYKEWLEEYDDMIKVVYDLAYSHLPEGSSPPPWEWVYNIVRPALNLWVNKHDVCDPPRKDFSSFDVTILGQYRSIYYEHHHLSIRDDPTDPSGFTEEVTVIPASPWPPTDRTADSWHPPKVRTKSTVRAAVRSTAATGTRNKRRVKAERGKNIHTSEGTELAEESTSSESEVTVSALNCKVPSHDQTAVTGRSRKPRVASETTSRRLNTPSKRSARKLQASDRILRPRRALTPVMRQ